jgi:nucleotide-binding universal stress UspA family protein
MTSRGRIVEVPWPTTARIESYVTNAPSLLRTALIDVSRSRSPPPRPLRLPEGSDHRIAQLLDEPLAEAVVGQNADELEDRLRTLVGEEREQRIAQVVLHLRAGEPWPEVLEQVDKLRGHELVVAGRPTLEEVEAARMGSVGKPQDVDPADRRARDPAQDVGDQVAVRVDDRRADVRLDRSQREVEQERALARAGRPECDDVAREDPDRDCQRPTARLGHYEAELA